MSPKQVIKTSNAPDPVGPYNQAIKAGDLSIVLVKLL